MSAAANTRNLENYWMPFTANRQFKQAPRLLESAQGMYYRDVDGNQILDGTAGLWCVNAGHGRREITGHVLGQFAADEAGLMKKVLARAVDQTECWLTAGIGKAMSQFNGVVDSENERIKQ